MNRLRFQTSTTSRLTFVSLSSSTGKEKDSESGYHYFGARYYDSEALTGWLSVDPMSDKYPSLSPYNYCAWNPVKFVDPNGDSVHVGFKNRDEGNNALLSSLKHKTELDLYVDDRGMMRYRKSESGSPITNGGSESARNDLIKSIEDKIFYLDLHYTKDNTDVSGGSSDRRTPKMNVSNVWLDISDFSGEENATFDIGMVFLHEFQHGYFGLSDNVTTSVNIYSCKNYDYYKQGYRGDVVDRVNIYRKELGLPTREAYAASPYTNKIPFKKGTETIWLNSYKKK